jgi:hypothetical protein
MCIVYLDVRYVWMSFLKWIQGIDDISLGLDKLKLTRHDYNETLVRLKERQCEENIMWSWTEKTKDSITVTVDETWLVRLPHNQPVGELSEIKVLSFTDNTIKFIFTEDTIRKTEHIFESSTINFIDKVK